MYLNSEFRLDITLRVYPFSNESDALFGSSSSDTTRSHNRIGVYRELVFYGVIPVVILNIYFFFLFAPLASCNTIMTLWYFETF